MKTPGIAVDRGAFRPEGGWTGALTAIKPNILVVIPVALRQEEVGAALARRGVGLIGEGRGPIRARGSALWPWSLGAARPHLPHRPAFVPVPHRPLGRRQDLAVA